MKITIIAAVAQNGVIGQGGGIPWRLPADLAFFKRTTMGHHLLLGRKTHESLPGALPGRTILVMSRTASGENVVRSLDEAIQIARDAGDDELFIGGGEEVYRLALPITDRMLLTEVDTQPDGDTRFPPYEESQWREASSESHEPDDRNPFAYVFRVLERVRSSA